MGSHPSRIEDEYTSNGTVGEKNKNHKKNAGWWFGRRKPRHTVVPDDLLSENQVSAHLDASATPAGGEPKLPVPSYGYRNASIDGNATEVGQPFHLGPRPQMTPQTAPPTTPTVPISTRQQPLATRLLPPIKTTPITTPYSSFTKQADDNLSPTTPSLPSSPSTPTGGFHALCLPAIDHRRAASEPPLTPDAKLLSIPGIYSPSSVHTGQDTNQHSTYHIRFEEKSLTPSINTDTSSHRASSDTSSDAHIHTGGGSNESFVPMHTARRDSMSLPELPSQNYRRRSLIQKTWLSLQPRSFSRKARKVEGEGSGLEKGKKKGSKGLVRRNTDKSGKVVPVAVMSAEVLPADTVIARQRSPPPSPINTAITVMKTGTLLTPITTATTTTNTSFLSPLSPKPIFAFNGMQVQSTVDMNELGAMNLPSTSNLNSEGLPLQFLSNSILLPSHQNQMPSASMFSVTPVSPPTQSKSTIYLSPDGSFTNAHLANAGYQVPSATTPFSLAMRDVGVISATIDDAHLHLGSPTQGPSPTSSFTNADGNPATTKLSVPMPGISRSPSQSSALSSSSEKRRIWGRGGGPRSSPNVMGQGSDGGGSAGVGGHNIPISPPHSRPPSFSHGHPTTAQSRHRNHSSLSLTVSLPPNLAASSTTIGSTASERRRKEKDVEVLVRDRTRKLAASARKMSAELEELKYSSLVAGIQRVESLLEFDVEEEGYE
ncbi:hypothetical protein HDV00_005675 [Rhizophlyctis rosea]|nr:hypothetical protein HDV00_005675 [Rhizophlyctis rosea]